MEVVLLHLVPVNREVLGEVLVVRDIIHQRQQVSFHQFPHLKEDRSHPHIQLLKVILVEDLLIVAVVELVRLEKIFLLEKVAMDAPHLIKTLKFLCLMVLLDRHREDGLLVVVEPEAEPLT